jgi:hypothetical protein
LAVVAVALLFAAAAVGCFVVVAGWVVSLWA